jgi:uncharacterized membrane protein YraQ (UPF0718 family)
MTVLAGEPRAEWRKLAWGLAAFGIVLILPVGWPRFDDAIVGALALVQWYAREHVLLCLVPAFFIAGAIAVFVRAGAVMKYLGPAAPKPLAYGVASVSGTVLAVCSCTVLPLFAGIWRMGAGLGPATAFLYAGPAVNVLAIVLTAAVLGPELGAARAIGAIVFSVVIGLAMHGIFRREETARREAASTASEPAPPRPLRQTGLHFGVLVGILVLANWSRPASDGGAWHVIWLIRWPLVALLGVALAASLVAWFGVPRARVLQVVGATAVTWIGCALWLAPRLGEGAASIAVIPFTVAVIGLGMILGSAPPGTERRDWLDETWGFAKLITPLLFVGIVIAGLLLGSPGEEGLVPSAWITSAVGGNSLRANLFASVAGAFMYFATLTEVPILQGLIDNGMGKGPALALLLAGPALSLPNMLVIRSIMGTHKTLVFVVLVIAMSTLAGVAFGALA